MSRAAIPVGLADPRDKVFVAMPYDTQFNRLSWAISEAVHQANLRAYQPNRSLFEDDWQEAIYLNIKSARVFIAVCTPEPKTSAPNANVMYELGFARCLGIPTIVLTTDMTSLPADVRTLQSLNYREPLADLDRETFLSELCERVLAKANEKPPSGRVPPAQGALLTSALAILECVRWLHKGYLLPQSLGRLAWMMEIGLDKGASRWTVRHAESCRRAWEEYVLQFQATRDLVLVRYQGERAEMERSFQELESADPDGPLSGRREAFCQLMDQALREYPDMHDGLRRAREHGPDVFDGSSDLRVEFWPQLSELSRKAQAIVQLSDTLMSALIGASRRHGRSHV
jgi:hypothetical protein